MKWKLILKRYVFLFLVAGIIVLIDQLTKAYIRATFTGPEGTQMWAPWEWMLPYARIVHVNNSGVAFGMFQGGSTVFAVFSAIVSLAIIYYYPQVPDEDRVLRISMSLMLAGAVGNLIDRVFNNGVVTDFISVGNFPVFNIADSSITIGVVILIIGMWYQERQQKKIKEAEQRLEAALDRDAPARDNG